jgi:hypothetical protein
MPVNYAFVGSSNSANVVVTIFGRTIALEDVNATINSFGKLPQGWAYGRGGPIPEKILQVGREWTSKLGLLGFQHVEAFPGDEEVLLAVSDGDNYFELIFEPDDTISIAYDYKRKQVFYRSHMSEEQAQKALFEIVGRKWSASDYCILGGTMRKNTSLPDLHSAILGRTELYLSSTGTVSMAPANLLESILEPTTKNTQRWFGSHLSSGNSTPQPSSQRATA